MSKETQEIDTERWERSDGDEISQYIAKGVHDPEAFKLALQNQRGIIITDISKVYHRDIYARLRGASYRIQMHPLNSLTRKSYQATIIDVEDTTEDIVS